MPDRHLDDQSQHRSGDDWNLPEILTKRAERCTGMHPFVLVEVGVHTPPVSSGLRTVAARDIADKLAQLIHQPLVDLLVDRLQLGQPLGGPGFESVSMTCDASDTAAAGAEGAIFVVAARTVVARAV